MNNNTNIEDNNKSIQYFQLYWHTYIASLLENDGTSVELTSPRMLINDVISEVLYNKLKNKDNLNYFKEQLSNWYKKDSVFNSISGIDIQNALQHFFVEKKQRMLLEICRKIQRDLDDNNYFDRLFDDFVDFLCNHSDVNIDIKEKIRLYTQLIIAEFVIKGYDLKDIHSLAYNIPNVIRVQGGEIIAAPDEYFEISRSQYSSDQEYYTAVTARINQRSIKEILLPITERYHLEPFDAHLIVPLSYIKGVNEINIAGVTIYSPKVRRFINEENDIEKETTFLNLYAAIPIYYIGLHSAIKQAKSKMDEVLDMLSIYYETENGVEYKLGRYCVVKDGNIIAESMSRSEIGMKNVDEFYINVKAINVDILNGDKEEISSLYQSLQSINDEKTFNRLKNALYWCRKASSATTREERLLHSWFALEGLLTISDEIRDCILSNNSSKIDEIKEIVVSICGRNIYQYKYKVMYYNFLWRVKNKRMDIPIELLKRFGLQREEQKKVKVNDFIRCLSELSNYTSDELLKDELYSTQQFYTNVDFYDDEIKILKNNLQNIYRYRNLIVHNAIIPIESTEFYSQQAYKICREVVAVLLKKCTQNNISIEQALLQIMIDYQNYYAQLPLQIQSIWKKR